MERGSSEYMTFDEIESQISAEEEASKAATTQPEVVQQTAPAGTPYAGKTMGEIVAQLEAANNALRISEQARLERQNAPAAPAQQPEPELSKDELQELFQTDPTAAMEYVTARALKQASAQLETRLSGLQSGAASTMETQMKAQFPLEFELFGDQIEKFAKSIPDQSQLSHRQSWEDMIAYVRGRAGNLEKYIERKTTPAPVAARAAQQASAGAHFSAGPAAVPGDDAGAGSMDAVTKQIADEFIAAGTFKNYEEYNKWSKMGGSK